MSATKTGRGCLLDNRGALRPQETRAGLLESLAALWTSRSGGCLSAPAFGDFAPGPRSGSATRLGSTPQAHRGTPYSLFLRPVATHDIAAARATASGQDLLDLTPPTGILPGAGRGHVRCWIQTPRQEQRREHDATAGDSGDKRDCGKRAHRSRRRARGAGEPLAAAIAGLSCPGMIARLKSPRTCATMRRRPTKRRWSWPRTPPSPAVGWVERQR